jgi:hypothetical protein
MPKRPLLAAVVLACLAGAPPVFAVCGDGVAELPVEGCDGDDDDACPGLCIPPGLPDECQCAFPVCGDGVVSPPEECEGIDNANCATGCAPDCSCRPLDHYQCYEIKPAAFTNAAVTIEDRFGTLSTRARFPHRLCAPADKNGEAIVDEISHLTGYTIRAPFVRVTDRRVENQFGELRLDVLRPDLLMVPTAKNGVAMPQGSDLDHFQCYRVKRTTGSPKFTVLSATVSDQFEAVTVRLQRPTRLCVAANKNGEDPTARDHRQHLLCYKTRGPEGFGTIDATLENQFGPDSVRLIHRRELCVPTQFASSGGE